jgi:hypothetical protein
MWDIVVERGDNTFIRLRQANNMLNAYLKLHSQAELGSTIETYKHFL